MALKNQWNFGPDYPSSRILWNLWHKMQFSHDFQANRSAAFQDTKNQSNFEHQDWRKVNQKQTLFWEEFMSKYFWEPWNFGDSVTPNRHINFRLLQALSKITRAKQLFRSAVWRRFCSVSRKSSPLFQSQCQVQKPTTTTAINSQRGHEVRRCTNTWTMERTRKIKRGTCWNKSCGGTDILGAISIQLLIARKIHLRLRAESNISANQA